MGKPKKGSIELQGRISLKMLAAHLGLNPATISVVLNEVPGRSIPEATRERIRAAAKKFHYQPSLLARSLRRRETKTIGILVPVLGDGYHTEVLSGIGDYLMEHEYFYFIAHHGHRADLVEKYPRLLVGRGAEGMIIVDTHLEHDLLVPVVAVAGHQKIRGVTNVVLDHRKASQLALTHLYKLGHREIAFMRGQPFSSDSDVRWASTVETARDLGLRVLPELTIQLDKDITTPELGYPVIQQLLAHRRKFTALVSFNDISAIGAIRALKDANLCVPQDVSVVGFDDIHGAAFQSPSLTTIRQPLYSMGKLAAQVLLDRLEKHAKHPLRIAVEPELIVRESTCTARRMRKSASRGAVIQNEK